MPPIAYCRDCRTFCRTGAKGKALLPMTKNAIWSMTCLESPPRTSSAEMCKDLLVLVHTHESQGLARPFHALFYGLDDCEMFQPPALQSRSVWCIYPRNAGIPRNPEHCRLLACCWLARRGDPPFTPTTWSTSSPSSSTALPSSTALRGRGAKPHGHERPPQCLGHLRRGVKVAASRVPPSSTPPSETCGQHSTPFTFYSRHLGTSPGPTQPSLLLLPQGIRGVSGPPAYWPPICYGAFGGVKRLFESRIFYIYMVDNLNCKTRTCLPLSLSLPGIGVGQDPGFQAHPSTSLYLSLPLGRTGMSRSASRRLTLAFGPCGRA